MISEIFIEGYKADISADLASLLTFAIDDVKDFASRSTTFSKTIVLPGTDNNNRIFGNIFETGSSNDYDSTLNNIGYNFNASKSARCLIFQDNLQTFKGTMRLLEIVKDGENIEYEVAVFGELSGLNVALSSGLLEDLDFSAYDEAWIETNIVNSWDNTPGSGVYYPLIDFGTYSTNKHDWDFRTFRPAFYAREYIDKMFTAASYRWQGDLFDTDRFKRLIVPHNQKTLQHLTSRILAASRNDVSHVLDSGTAPSVALEFSSVVTSIFTASGSNSKFTYNGLNPVNLTLTLLIFGNYKAPNVGFTLTIKKNGVEIPTSTLTIPVTGDSIQRFYTWSASENITLTTNDYIEIFYTATTGFITPDFITATNGNLFIDSLTPIPTEVSYGDSIQMNYIIPKNIRQVDFLVSIVKLFNLYVYESQFDERLILIKPYVDFYSTDSHNAVDWTYKLNRDAPQKIRPMSELNAKIYNFRYKSDTDYYNDLYKKRYNQNYGDHIFDSEFEFAQQSSGLDLIFSSTPLVGYSGEEKVYPTIFKLNNSVEERIDSNIRIMQTKKVTGVSSWDLLDGASVLSSLTDYGYAGHFDDPDSPDNDLNFGLLEELFFILGAGDLTKTQFNLYWSSYMAEITDKDSKMLEADFYLTAKDIFSLDFSKYVTVDNVLWRLNKIQDYNVTIPNTCKVELLRVINTLY